MAAALFSGRIGRGLWMTLAGVCLLASAARAGEIFDADDEPFAEVAPAVADVADRFDFRNQPVNLTEHVAVGEWMKYRVRASALSLPIGTIELACRRQRMIRRQPALTMQMLVVPNDLTGLVYKDKTEITTNINAATGRSEFYSCLFKAPNGTKKREEYIQFDYEDVAPAAPAQPLPPAAAGAVAQTKRDRLRKNGRRETNENRYPIPGDMQDALSMFYYGRALPLTRPGDSARVLVGGVRDLAAVTLMVEGEERVKLPGLGEVDCLVVRPVADAGAEGLASFKGAARFWMEKTSRIPVKIELATGEPLIGSATALLFDCDGNNPLREALKAQ